jgi:lipoate-protein ligase A
VVVGPGTLNLAVVLSNDAAPGLEAVDVAQRFVLERLAEALRVWVPGIAVRGHGDLALGQRKFAGSAQRRLRRHFLVHATILYAFPLDRIARYLNLPRRQPEYRAGRSHQEFLINLDLPRAALVAAVRSAWSIGEPPGEAAAIPDDLVRRLVATKYADPAWTERF